MTRNKQRAISTEEEVFYNSSDMRHRLGARKRTSINYNMIWTYKCQILSTHGLGAEGAKRNPWGYICPGDISGVKGQY